MKNQISEIYKTLFIPIRGIMILVLTLVLLIPQFFITQLVDERSRLQQEVEQEVANKWANAQTVCTPLLAIPYTRADSISSYLWIQPKTVLVNGEIIPEIKHRSIYKVPLYVAHLNISGSFDAINRKELTEKYPSLQWNKSQLVMKISDYNGIETSFANNKNTFAASEENYQFYPNSISSSFPIIDSSAQAFKFDISLKGSKEFLFQTNAESAEINLKSSWENPSFQGNMLPTSTVDKNGFTAKWKKIDVLQSIKPIFTDKDYYYSDLNSYGVKLYETNTSYSKINRCIKYAILIIGLTFLIYLFIELLQKKRIQSFQYILVGVAICVFYLLVLSISEYTSFSIAYVIATIAVVLQITLFTSFIFQSKKTGLVFGTMFTALYGFMYSIIELEDYALIAGSVGIFIILSLIMYFSRSLQQKEIKSPQPTDHNPEVE